MVVTLAYIALFWFSRVILRINQKAIPRRKAFYRYLFRGCYWFILAFYFSTTLKKLIYRMGMLVRIVGAMVYVHSC